MSYFQYSLSFWRYTRQFYWSIFTNQNKSEYTISEPIGKPMLNLKLTEINSKKIILLNGDLDSDGGAIFREYMSNFKDDTNIFDISALNRITSEGLRELCLYSKKVYQNKKQVILLQNPNRQVIDMIEASGVYMHFKFVTTHKVKTTKKNFNELVSFSLVEKML